MNKRPSDPGGQGQGSPTAGGKQRSGAFNASQKSIGHTEEFWVRKITKDMDLSDDEARNIVKTWEKEYKKSGTIYYPTIVEEDELSPGLAETVQRKKRASKMKYAPRSEDMIPDDQYED